MGKQKLTTLTSWFQPPTFTDDEDKTRSALLLNVILNTFLIALPVIFATIVLGASTSRREITLTVIAGAWLMIFGVRLTMLTGRVVVAGTLTVLVIFNILPPSEN